MHNMEGIGLTVKPEIQDDSLRYRVWPDIMAGTVDEEDEGDEGVGEDEDEEQDEADEEDLEA